MGSRVSGTLAIIAMDRFETLHIYQQPKFQDLAVYVLYIDDTGTVLKSRNDAMDMLTYLNDQHKSIKFEMELPDIKNFQPILDVRIGIDGDGSVRSTPLLDGRRHQ